MSSDTPLWLVLALAVVRELLRAWDRRERQKGHRFTRDDDGHPPAADDSKA